MDTREFLVGVAAVIFAISLGSMLGNYLAAAIYFGDLFWIFRERHL